MFQFVFGAAFETRGLFLLTEEYQRVRRSNNGARLALFSALQSGSGNPAVAASFFAPDNTAESVAGSAHGGRISIALNGASDEKNRRDRRHRHAGPGSQRGVASPP